MAHSLTTDNKFTVLRFSQDSKSSFSKNSFPPVTNYMNYNNMKRVASETMDLVLQFSFKLFTFPRQMTYS